jgi:hypothetical protein
VNNIPALGLHPLDLWPCCEFLSPWHFFLMLVYDSVQILPLRVFGSKLVRDTLHRIDIGKRMREEMWQFGMDRLGTVLQSSNPIS